VTVGFDARLAVLLNISIRGGHHPGIMTVAARLTIAARRAG